MLINELQIKNFRNFNNQVIKFHPQLNFIVGQNGQGKTNLLESLFFITNLKSFRTSNYKNLIFFNEGSSYLEASVTKQKVLHEIQINIQPQGKSVFLDKKPIFLSSDFIQSFYTTLFSPDMAANFKLFPAIRRSFFDRFIALISSDYLEKIKNYNQIQKNKNLLLRQKKRKEIMPWNIMLSNIIPTLCSLRKKIILLLNQKINCIFRDLTSREETLMIDYHSDFLSEQLTDSAQVLSNINSRLEKELTLGYMVYGIHKDQFSLNLAGKKNKDLFSQGEYRIAFLALLLAVNQIIYTQKNFYPLLLLDDIFSELDANNSAKIIDFISEKNNQVFITSTQQTPKLSRLGVIFHIEGGNIL